MKPTFTYAAERRAEESGIKLCEKTSRSILAKIKNNDGAVWEDVVSQPDDSVCRLFFMEHGGVRIRVITDNDISRIVSLSKSSGTPLHVIQKAEKFGLVLNKAMQKFIVDKIRANDRDIFSSEDGEKPFVRVIGMTIMDEDYKIIYSDANGVIINIDKHFDENSSDKTIIRSQHPFLSHHAAERAVERYDIEITKPMADSIIERIRVGDCIDNYGAGNDTRAAILEIQEGVKACVIYTPFPQIKIITVAPMEYHERRSLRLEKSKEAKRKQKSKRVRFHRQMKLQEEEDSYANLY